MTSKLSKRGIGSFRFTARGRINKTMSSKNSSSKRRGRARSRARPPVPVAKKSLMASSFRWLASAGVLLALATAAYSHIFGNVSLQYERALDRGYEFSIRNNTPSDRTIRQFRLRLPDQKVIYTTTKDILATVNEKTNSISLPGGNIHEVPASNFRELDGRVIPANEKIKFRIPPLSNHPWVEPDAIIVVAEYSFKSTNRVLATADWALSFIGLSTDQHLTRFVVLNNNWWPTNVTSKDEAIRQLCRDDANLQRGSTCHGFR